MTVGKCFIVALLQLVVLAHMIQAVRIWKHYIAAEEVDWDYSGGATTNIIEIVDQENVDRYFKTSSTTVGSRYKKAMYVEYTDGTFSTQAPRPSYMGLVGPLLKGEVGDVLHIVFFNNGSREYSMHPHGLIYLKVHESAIYMDGTSGVQKSDDIVFPGERVEMFWNITENDAPGAGDPNCIPWVYHSHIDTGRDTSAGLIGVIATCRPGTLDGNGRRTDVQHEFPLLLKIFDENLSWYSQENAQRCSSPNQCPSLQDVEDEDYIESNYMASINGYMYGYLPGLTACVGERVAFYVIGMGNEFDVHSLHFHGQSMEYQHRRGDTVSVFSATFVEAETTPTMAGYWQISDMVDSNEQNGMSAFWFTTNCASQGIPSNAAPNGGSVWTYFLAAEEIMWDYGPSGFDSRTGQALTDPASESFKYFEQSSERIGGRYRKAAFHGYTDNSFTFRNHRSPTEEHMGIQGPVLRAEVGDVIMVTLTNRLQFPVSLLPHGLTYSSTEELRNVPGSHSSGGEVKPGESFTYWFYVPDDVLGNSNGPCRNFLYTSAHDPSKDHNTGLVGPILICQKGYTRNMTDKDLENEKFLLFTVFDENKSQLLSDNMNNTTVDGADADFQESNMMFSVNGYSFGNLPGLNACVGDNITWYLSSVGSVQDVHTVTFDGNTFAAYGKHRDVESLVPGSSDALRMNLDSPGRWLVQSHTIADQINGMYAMYEVGETGNCTGGNAQNVDTTGATIREYFIAAVELDWDYAPFERSPITGEDLDDPRSEGNIFVKTDADFIGDVYKKAVYREFTDSSFTQQTSRTDYDIHLDMLGPAIKAEVGEVIKIVFKNMASRAYSIHAHGVQYDADNSGLDYVTNQTVQPGEVKEYRWLVPERSGPGASDPNCIPWLYYSSVNPERDVYSGLVGGMIICRTGTLDSSGRRRNDVDREFFLLMGVDNENKSWYIDENILNQAPHRRGTNYMEDPDFEESNLIHAMNGRIYGNTQGLVIPYNSTVAWYFMAIGTEIDLHSFHIHGHTLIKSSENHRDDSIAIFPGQAEALEMRADNPGTWLLHCHTLDHITAGMETTYTVLRPGESTRAMSVN